MAVPFGGHPTLERFVEWATGGGCKAAVKVRTHSVSGKPYEVLEITGPGGGSVAMVNPNFKEFLAPSQIAYITCRDASVCDLHFRRHQNSLIPLQCRSGGFSRRNAEPMEPSEPTPSRCRG
jgi:hypothetical protein